jgi:hypothetical protein
MAKLNSAHLPEKKEIEAYDQDVLEIPVRNLYLSIRVKHSWPQFF